MVDRTQPNEMSARVAAFPPLLKLLEERGARDFQILTQVSESIDDGWDRQEIEALLKTGEDITPQMVRAAAASLSQLLQQYSTQASNLFSSAQGAQESQLAECQHREEGITQERDGALERLEQAIAQYQALLAKIAGIMGFFGAQFEATVEAVEETEKSGALRRIRSRLLTAAADTFFVPEAPPTKESSREAKAQLAEDVEMIYSLAQSGLTPDKVLKGLQRKDMDSEGMVARILEAEKACTASVAELTAELGSERARYEGMMAGTDGAVKAAEAALKGLVDWNEGIVSAIASFEKKIAAVQQMFSSDFAATVSPSPGPTL